MTAARQLRRTGPVGRRRVASHGWSMCCTGRRADAVSVKVRQMQTAKTRASEHERKETEAETDRETDQIKI